MGWNEGPHIPLGCRVRSNDVSLREYLLMIYIIVPLLLSILAGCASQKNDAVSVSAEPAATPDSSPSSAQAQPKAPERPRQPVATDNRPDWPTGVTKDGTQGSPTTLKEEAQAANTNKLSRNQQVMAAYLETLKGKKPILPPPAPLRTEVPGACRSPDEPGCARCCLSSTPAFCRTATKSLALEGEGTAPSRYGTGAYSDGPCADDCRPCAHCTAYDEWRLANLEPLGCDCRDNHQPVVDPGFARMGCDVYCVTLRKLLGRCPHLHPAR